MKRLLLALLGTIALSQDAETGDTAPTETAEPTEPEPVETQAVPVRQETTLNTASITSNKVTMTVTVSEVYNPPTQENPTESVTLYFNFNTGGTRWSDGTFVQTYLSIQDPDI